jgi:hypothetical protein
MPRIDKTSVPADTPCHPDSALTEPRLCDTRGCVRCDATLVFTWHPDGLDGWWVDLDGSISGGEVPGGFEDGWALMDHLSRPGAPGRDLSAYSSLLANRHSMAAWPWEHRHQPKECDHGCPPVTVPECHGWPMQAVRDGWRCRVAKILFPYP